MSETSVTLPDGVELLHFEEIDSTSSEAARQIAAGNETPTWIWADRQVAGRGRRGREWVSQSGNLFCTLMLPVTVTVAEAAKLSFVAALAGAAMVEHFAPGADVQVKWPNDVLLRGKKVMGILLESNTSTIDQDKIVLSIGIGVNLTSYPDNVETKATSIQSQGFEAPLPADALSVLANETHRLLAIWEQKGFGPLREAWLAKAKGVGQDIRVRLPHETLLGVFDGLDDTGALVLKKSDGGVQLITAGEVFFED